MYVVVGAFCGFVCVYECVMGGYREMCVWWVDKGFTISLEFPGPVDNTEGVTGWGCWEHVPDP